MPGIFEYGGNAYDIDDLKVAVRNGDGTYGLKIDVPGVSMFRAEFQTKNQRANGDGGIVAIASAFEAANVTMRNVGISTAHWGILFPTLNYESGSTPNRVRRFYQQFNIPLPYFGVLARIFDGESRTAGMIIFIPRIKVMNNVQWSAEYNTFVTPEITGMGLADTTLSDPSGQPLSFVAYIYESNMPLLSSINLPLL